MQIVDTHCHLDEDGFTNELDDVIARARDNGVHGIVTIGTTVAGSRRAIALAERFPGCVFPAVGIHPNYTHEAQPGDWDIIEELAAHPKVVAVGETGLDRYWDYAPVEIQRDYFQRHLALSRCTGKPFIVHCRDADEEVRDMLRTEAAANGPLHGVMHSFCQSLDSARECISLGMHLSFTGMLTFKSNHELREIASQIPRDRVFVETDAPYLAPVPNRGKRNEPAWVRHTLESLAGCHNVPLEEMAAITTASACRFFGITLS